MRKHTKRYVNLQNICEIKANFVQIIISPKRVLRRAKKSDSYLLKCKVGE